jgi:hypothetical protein
MLKSMPQGTNGGKCSTTSAYPEFLFGGAGVPQASLRPRKSGGTDPASSSAKRKREKRIGWTSVTSRVLYKDFVIAGALARSVPGKREWQMRRV